MSKKHLAIAMATATMATQSWALEPLGYKTAESLVLTPLLKISERWDDNIRAVETGAEDSFVTTITPALSMDLKGRKVELNVGLETSSDIFHSSHDDDNTDGKITSALGLNFDARNRLRFDAGYSRTEDISRQYQPLENDRYTIANVGALYGFGAQTARAQIEVGTSYEQLRFQNDLRLSSGGILNDERERDTAAAKATFYMAVGPKTRVLAEVRHTQFAYVHNTPLDSTNLALLAGVAWQATGKTTGTVKAGTEKKEFDSGGDADNSMWEADVSWSPVRRATFSLSSSSHINEGYNGALVVESQSTTLTWTHQWLKRLSSEMGVTVGAQDFVGAYVPNGQQRSDDLLTAGLGVTYHMQRWLDFGLGYKFAKDDSNAPGRSFERNIASLSVSASL